MAAGIHGRPSTGPSACTTVHGGHDLARLGAEHAEQADGSREHGFDGDLLQCPGAEEQGIAVRMWA